MADARTPRFKRRHALREAIERANLASRRPCHDQWHWVFERELAKAGYHVSRMSSRQQKAADENDLNMGGSYELRQRAAEDGSALEAAGDSANH